MQNCVRACQTKSLEALANINVSRSLSLSHFISLFSLLLLLLHRYKGIHVCVYAQSYVKKTLSKHHQSLVCMWEYKHLNHVMFTSEWIFPVTKRSSSFGNGSSLYHAGESDNEMTWRKDERSIIKTLLMSEKKKILNTIKEKGKERENPRSLEGWHVNDKPNWTSFPEWW